MNSNYKIDLDSLRVIEAIVDQGSFSGAALALHRVPSTISYTVSKLENSFNVKFFEREKHGVKLTEAGRELVRHSKHILQIAADAEKSIERIATGWESELSIALGDLINPNALMPLLDDLFKLSPQMQVRVSTEVLNGMWDSLAANRADLIIGVDDTIPSTMSGISTAELGYYEFVFAVAANHPLATATEPLSHDDIKPYRVIAVSDTSRSIPHRSIGLLEGQSVLSVPTHQMKLEAQRLGLGVGTVSRKMVQPYLDDGQMVVKATELSGDRPYGVIYAWKNHHKGEGLKWLLQQLASLEIQQQLLDVG